MWLRMIINFGKEVINMFQKYKIAFTTGAMTALGLALPLLAHAQQITLAPTDQANITGAVSSLPNTAYQEVLPILEASLPYVLFIVALGVAFFIVRKVMHHAR